MERVALILLIVLLGMYFMMARKAVTESFENLDRYDETHEHETVGRDYKLSDLDDKHDKEAYVYEEPKNFDSGDIQVSDTIELRDTTRRDSKIPSSLDYTYVDEQCSKIVKPVHSPYPVDELVTTEPRTPLVNYAYNEEKPIPKNDLDRMSVIERNVKSVRKIKEVKDDVYSEMWDDEGLKPKPDVDSPYGFVYFPNKYWKMWHQKAPICTPANGACKVLPTYTEGTPVNVLDYTQIGSMMPKFEYNEEYEQTD